MTPSERDVLLTKLAEFREKWGVSYAAIARKRGVSRSAVWHTFNLERTPHEETVRGTARALGLTVEKVDGEWRLMIEGN